MSSDVVVSVEKLGKSYLLRHEAGGTRYRRLSEELVEALVRPFRLVHRWGRGAQSSGRHERASRERFWALRDVSFKVTRGEVLGIMGRNGAGKSTLLKILSRITEPTVGRVRFRGRIASLLEVGTGFHPELTGRENIFLNGTILGMSRREIQRKFEEIVAFAEVEKFLDTPVKRYSSGMYVRLAFAVAAHLEPEILIVDEVLSVGDLQFQKKCIGKMKDVAIHGRTVLFVSHNLAAMQSLTQTGLVLDAGKVAFMGRTQAAVEFYAKQQEATRENSTRSFGRGTHTAIHSVVLLDAAYRPTSRYIPRTRFTVRVILETDGTRGLSLDMVFQDAVGVRIGLMSLYQFHGRELPDEPGVYNYDLEFDGVDIASGAYRVDVATSVVNVVWDHYINSALEFDVPFSGSEFSAWDFKQAYGYGNMAFRCAKVPVPRRMGDPLPKA